MSSSDDEEFHDANVIVGSLQSHEYHFYSDKNDSDDSGDVGYPQRRGTGPEMAETIDVDSGVGDGEGRRGGGGVEKLNDIAESDHETEETNPEHCHRNGSTSDLHAAAVDGASDGFSGRICPAEELDGKNKCYDETSNSNVAENVNEQGDRDDSRVHTEEFSKFTSVIDAEEYGAGIHHESHDTEDLTPQTGEGLSAAMQNNEAAAQFEEYRNDSANKQLTVSGNEDKNDEEKGHICYEEPPPNGQESDHGNKNQGNGLDDHDSSCYNKNMNLDVSRKFQRSKSEQHKLIGVDLAQTGTSGDENARKPEKLTTLRSLSLQLPESLPTSASSQQGLCTTISAPQSLASVPGPSAEHHIVNNESSQHALPQPEKANPQLTELPQTAESVQETDESPNHRLESPAPSETASIASVTYDIIPGNEAVLKPVDHSESCRIDRSIDNSPMGCKMPLDGVNDSTSSETYKSTKIQNCTANEDSTYLTVVPESSESDAHTTECMTADGKSDSTHGTLRLISDASAQDGNWGNVSPTQVTNSNPEIDPDSEIAQIMASDSGLNIGETGKSSRGCSSSAETSTNNALVEGMDESYNKDNENQGDEGGKAFHENSHETLDDKDRTGFASSPTDANDTIGPTEGNTHMTSTCQQEGMIEPSNLRYYGTENTTPQMNDSYNFQPINRDYECLAESKPKPAKKPKAKSVRSPESSFYRPNTLIRYDSPMIDTVHSRTHSYGSNSITPHSARHVNDGYSQSWDHSYETIVPTGKDEDNETSHLIQKDVSTVYTRRWYVLAVFCLTSLLQGLGWGSWGPITQSAKSVFGWTDTNIALLALAGNASYVLFAIPISWMVERKGLRFSMIISMLLQAAGFGARCITSATPVATWLMNTGQILIGGGAVVPYSAVSLLSSVWFPPNQRTTATSIATIFGYIGLSLGFIVGPVLVPEPASDKIHNISIYGSHDNVTDVGELRSAIMDYMYYQAGLAGVILILVLVYFPAQPPTPPSVTAHIERLELKSGLQSLMRNKQFLLILSAYSIGTGIYGGFTIILDIDVKPLGVSQETAGWMGFYATIGGCAAGFLFSRLSDIFMRRLKLLLILMFIPSVGAFVWFGLLVGRYIPKNMASLYFTAIFPGCLNTGSLPLFYELACEAAYPTGEGITTLILTVVNNIFGVIFLLVLMIPNIGVTWMNWLLIGSTSLSVLLLFTIKENYHRTNIDTMEIIVPEP